MFVKQIWHYLNTYEKNKDQGFDKIHVAMVLQINTKKICIGVQKRIHIYGRHNEAVQSAYVTGYSSVQNILSHMHTELGIIQYQTMQCDKNYYCMI